MKITSMDTSFLHVGTVAIVLFAYSAMKAMAGVPGDSRHIENRDFPLPVTVAQLTVCSRYFAATFEASREVGESGTACIHPQDEGGTQVSTEDDVDSTGELSGRYVRITGIDNSLFLLGEDGSMRPRLPAAVANAIAVPELTDLTVVRSIGLDGPSDEQMHSLSSCSKLEILRIRTPLLTERGYHDIANFTALRRCYVEGGGVSIPLTDRGLTGFRNLRDLEWLDLPRTVVTDNGLSCLDKLGSLRHLQLRSWMITGEGFRHLSSLRNLRYLELGFPEYYAAYLPYPFGDSVTRLFDDGLRHISELQELEHLDLAGSPVSDTGLRHLTSLEKLTFLNLNVTNTTDAGLALLASIKSLRTVQLHTTKVTTEGIQSLRDALPRAAIGELKPLQSD